LDFGRDRFCVDRLSAGRCGASGRMI
jgi:hypothetical protein